MSAAMLEPGLLARLLKKTLSGGGEFADIFVEWKAPVSIQLEEGKIEKIISGVDSGAGMRLIKGGKTAFAFTNDLSETALFEMAGTLSRAYSGGRFEKDIDLSVKSPGSRFDIRLMPDSVPMEKKIEILSRANRVSRQTDSRVRQVSVVYRDFIQRVQIAASDGTLAEDERVHTLASVHVVTEDGGLIQTGVETAGGHTGFELFDETPLEEVALKAAKRALMMLSARRAPGGRMPVVISSEAGGTMIHEAIGHGLEADLAQQGVSVYSKRLGEQVASPLVTVIDSSILPGKRGSYRFDDEGIPSQSTVLVKDGILVGYMYDRLTAMRDNVKSTGNGRRESYGFRPIPRMTNTYIERGKSSAGDVLKLTPRGLFVKKMGGGQVNTVTGDFVFEVQEGYIIEDGRQGEPVRGATLTGNGPQILKSIDMVSSDLGFAIGTCGKDSQGVPVSDAMPTIRIPELVVGGEV
jgi:TldD protein